MEWRYLSPGSAPLVPLASPVLLRPLLLGCFYNFGYTCKQKFGHFGCCTHRAQLEERCFCCFCCCRSRCCVYRYASHVRGNGKQVDTFPLTILPSINVKVEVHAGIGPCSKEKSARSTLLMFGSKLGDFALYDLYIKSISLIPDCLLL